MEVKKLVPALRFPGFEGEWEKIIYNKLYSFKTTNSFSRDKLNYENGVVKNIHYGDIHTKFESLFNITNEIVPFINSDVDIARIPEECYLREGDLVIADASEDYNDIGKCIEIINLNNEKVIAGLHTFLARKESDNISTGFASFLMKTNRIRLNIMKIAQGTKVLSLSFKRLGEIQLLIPSIQEQQQIASFLRSVEQRIKALQKKKIALESYKKGMMQKLFSQEIRFKDEQDNYFTDWEEKKLGEIVKYYDGTHQTPKYVKKGIPFYSVEHVTANQFIKTKYITEEVYHREIECVKIENGDLLMTRIGSIGVVKYIDWDVKASFYVSLALIKKNGNINSRYLSHYINTSKFQKELWRRTIHVAFPKKINLGEIGECRISLPHLKEQNKIASFLSEIDEAIEIASLQVERTQEFKKGLLQKMFV